MNCPCGSGKAYATCCAPYLEGKALPPTPEALMRSRYVAYTQNNFDYIEETMGGASLETFDPKRAQTMAKDTQWTKLEVLSSSENGNRGTVQFIAFYTFRGEEQMMHEISTFEKIKGKWLYVGGEVS